MSSSPKLQVQSSASKYSNASSARSNSSSAERLPTAPFDRVTLTDIAADAGVSRATVSLVLRNVPVVAGPTRERVLDSMRRLGYVYHRGAANLRTQRTHAIGLIVTDITNPFFAEIIVAIEDKLGSAGYATLLGNTSETVGKQERLLASMLEYPADGILLCPAADKSDQFIDRIRDCRIPKVLFARNLPGVECDYVGVDNLCGARMAVEHLVALGHRRIAFIGGAVEVSSRKERVDGYAIALRKNGIRVDARDIVTCSPDRLGGYQTMSQLLAERQQPTAALCFNDMVAMGALQALANNGKSPGEDFAIIGFDDVVEAALCRPRLTTVATVPGKIGQASAELLLERISNPDRPTRRLIFKPKLIIRESCGGVSANQKDHS